MFSIKKILVPVDFSEHSERALRKAADIAVQFHAELFLLHVVDDRLFEYGSDVGIGLEDNIQTVVEQTGAFARGQLQKRIDGLNSTQPVAASIDVKTGHPAEAILEEEKERGIDLIVIGAHGRTGMIQHLLGGVADKVVRRSSSPVFVVK